MGDVNAGHPSFIICCSRCIILCRERLGRRQAAFHLSPLLISFAKRIYFMCRLEPQIQISDRRPIPEKVGHLMISVSNSAY